MVSSLYGPPSAERGLYGRCKDKITLLDRGQIEAGIYVHKTFKQIAEQTGKHPASEIDKPVKIILENQNIKSILQFSIMKDGKFKGFVGFSPAEKRQYVVSVVVQ